MNRQDAKDAKERKGHKREKKCLVTIFDSRLIHLLSFAVLGVLGVFLVVSCSPAPKPQPEAAPVETPPPVQETVSYLASDKNVHGYLCRPAGVGPYPAVLLIHDRLGLSDGIKDAAFRLARQDYVVLAVDLYRGHAPPRELPKERVLHDLEAAVNYLCQREEVRPEQQVEPEKRMHVLGAVGLGMGGSFALEAALHDPRLRALALCYCRLPTEAKQLTPLKASVFGIFAGKDKSVPLATIERFTAAMNEAGKNLYATRVYGESPHGFLDPANWPHYGKPHEGDVEDAWELIARFLDRVLM
jgi:carboxymethylenebutenolidase